MAGRRTYRTRAIVLDRTKLAEQDLILTLLAADGRQVRAVAKGARKPGGRLAARVELFCETDFLLAEGRSLDVVSEAQTVEPHARLRGDYERVAAASAVAEVARLTCFEDAPDAFLCPISRGRSPPASRRPTAPTSTSRWRPTSGRCSPTGDGVPSSLPAAPAGTPT